MTHETPPDPLKYVPELTARLQNEFLIVSVVYFLIVLAVGMSAPGVVALFGREFFVLIVILGFVAYLVVRVLMILVELRQKDLEHAENMARLEAENKEEASAKDETKVTPDDVKNEEETQERDEAKVQAPQPPSPPTTLSSDELRDRYLRELMGRCAHVKMTTIDIKAATRQEAAELDLAAVFTDLDVLEGHERDMERAAPAPDEMARDIRRVPALEALSSHPHLVLRGEAGSGKSTLVNFVAVCLAGDWLNLQDANIRRLGEAWRLPRLLPLRVILRDYAARGLSRGLGLWDFIKAELTLVETLDCTLDVCIPVLGSYLKRRDGAMVLLDGLDEVPDAHNYRLELKTAVEQFARDFPHCRLVVTTRPYAYQDPAAYLTGFDVRTLAPFSPEQIDAFIPRWYAHVGLKDPSLGEANAQRYAEQLQNAVKNNPRLAALANSPLLLTLMTSLHRWREGGSLPERRQELYEQSVVLLLDLWQRPKQVFDAQGQPTGKEYDVFTELGISQEALRRALNCVAYEAHWKQPKLTGTHDVRARDLAGVLYEVADKDKARDERRIIQYLTDRAGLLLERSQGQVYTFPHRTFQEYLAACYLTDEDYPYLLEERLREDDARWREAAMLAAAKAVGGAPATIWTLVSVFCPENWSPAQVPADVDWYVALRAAQAVVETEQHKRPPERQRFLLKRLQHWLVALIEGSHLPPTERAAAGRTLAVLGDPRDGVLTVCPLSIPPERGEVREHGEGAVFPPGGGELKGGKLPDLQWCYVPPGPFVMGASKSAVTLRHPETGEPLVVPPDPDARDDEGPVHLQPMPHGYWISRYPVTNAQFRAFVKDGGYGNDKWWTKSGWGWLQRDGRKGPRKYGGAFELDNHPVVGVTWYESVAFCWWLSDKLQGAGYRLQVERQLPEGNCELLTFNFQLETCRLPTEAEWEKAARGGLLIPAQPHPVPTRDLQLTPQNPQPLTQNSQSTTPNPHLSRRYPWGDGDITPQHANYDATGINGTSAVGAFPLGQSPYGALDMAGNVWEWTQTLWGESWQKPDFEYPYRVDDGREDLSLGDNVARVLRGGYFGNDEERLRCASRLSYRPVYASWYNGMRVVVSPSTLVSGASGL